MENWAYRTLDSCRLQYASLPSFILDIADKSVAHAITRFNQLNHGRPPFSAHFLAANCHKVESTPSLSPHT